MSQTKRAAMWAFLAVTGTRVVTLISLSVLARLLAPREFGLLAFAMVYMTYAETVGDLGTAVALIYWKKDREKAAQTTFIINGLMGLGWCLLTLLLAPFIAEFFRNPGAESIVRVLSFAFLIKYLGNTHDALAQKDLRFRARAIPEVGMAVTKAGLSIGLALAGFGAWSLVWGHLAGVTVWTIGSWMIVDWRPSWSLPRGLYAPMLRYGRGIVGVNVVAVAVHHADLTVVGRMLGPTALGLYQIADKIPDATVTIIIWVGSKVLFPAFARLRGNDELRRGYLQALTYVSLVTVPVAGGLAVAAEPVVRVLFGPNWLAAAPILRWLAIYAGVRSIGSHAGDILKATGRSGMLAGFGILKAAITWPALIFAAQYGAEKVAMTLAIVTGFTVLLNIAIVMRILDFGIGAIQRSLRTSFLAGAVLVGAAIGLQHALGNLPAQVVLAVTLGLGLLAYLGALFVIDRTLFHDLVTIVVPRRSA